MGSGTSASLSKNDSAEVIVSTQAFEAASVSILEYMKENGGISNEKTRELIQKYQNALVTVDTYFCGARAGKDILADAIRTLHKFGCTKENTIFGQSVCPDEINHGHGDITMLFSTYMGEVFHMGGLAGIPFTGQTGFTAFSHHVPDGGNLFILFAPHIGLSDAGELGKYSRIGQATDGSACGAACGALNHCIAHGSIPNFEQLGMNPYDYQMQFIISKLAPSTELISSKESVNGIQAELVYQMYIIVKDFLNSIVHTNFGISNGTKGNLILLGGIQINMPHPMMDYFQPLVFEKRREGEETIDLFADAFGRS